MANAKNHCNCILYITWKLVLALYTLAEAARLRRASTADDGASTITILVDIMMLGQSMLLVIASNMVNRMPIPGLMEYKASDYAESHSTCKQTLVVVRIFTLQSILHNSQTGYWRPTVSPPSRFLSPRMQGFPLYSL